MNFRAPSCIIDILLNRLTNLSVMLENSFSSDLGLSLTWVWQLMYCNCAFSLQDFITSVVLLIDSVISSTRLGVGVLDSLPLSTGQGPV